MLNSFFEYLIIAITLSLGMSYCYSQKVFINELCVSPPPDPLDSSISPGSNTNSMYNYEQFYDPPYNREWVELYNPNPCDTVDISCFTLGSNENNDFEFEPNWGAFTFPTGSKIPPLGFIIIGGNDAQVPKLDYNLTEYRENYWGKKYLDGDSLRWFLRDAFGWLALYDGDGNPINAVYWNMDSIPGELNLEQEYSSFIHTRTTCKGSMFLKPANKIAGIEFIGAPKESSVNTFQRERDGGKTWKRSAQPPTPRTSNGIKIVPQKINATFVNPTCPGKKDGSIIITITDGGTGPYSVVWNTNPPRTSKAIRNLSAGKYIVTVADAYKCFIVNDTITLTNPLKTPPVLSTSYIDPTCPYKNDGSASVSIINGDTGPYYIKWNTNPAKTSGTINNLAADKYVVTVSDSINCFIVSDTVTLTAPPGTTYDTLIKSDSCNNNKGSIFITSIKGNEPFNFVWEKDGKNLNKPDSMRLLKQIGAGNYKAIIYDKNNCKDSIEKTLTNILCKDIIIPNVFIPTHAVNSKFEIKNITQFALSNISCEMKIFNRWGAKVFENNHYENPENWWNGSNKSGEKIEAGAYFYVLFIKDKDNTTYQGTITLLY